MARMSVPSWLARELKSKGLASYISSGYGGRPGYGNRPRYPARRRWTPRY